MWQFDELFSDGLCDFKKLRRYVWPGPNAVQNRWIIKQSNIGNLPQASYSQVLSAYRFPFLLAWDEFFDWCELQKARVDARLRIIE